MLMWRKRPESKSRKEELGWGGLGANKVRNGVLGSGGIQNEKNADLGAGWKTQSLWEPFVGHVRNVFTVVAAADLEAPRGWHDGFTQKAFCTKPDRSPPEILYGSDMVTARVLPEGRRAFS